MQISADDAEVLAGWLGTVRTSPAVAARGTILAAVATGDEPPLRLSAMELMAIRKVLMDVNDLETLPDLLQLRTALESPPTPGRTRNASEILVVQVATFGGPKLGFEDDPEGGWTDHNVHVDRDSAETEMHELQRDVWVDESGDPREGVVTTVRIATIEEIAAELGDERVNRIMTVFRERLSEIWDDVG
jgi:hypothetical protein